MDYVFFLWIIYIICLKLGIGHGLVNGLKYEVKIIIYHLNFILFFILGEGYSLALTIMHCVDVSVHKKSIL
jgi:hypothetical protein